MLKQVINLTPAQQQQLLRRQQQISTQRLLLTTSTGAASGSQVVTTSRNVVMVHAPPGTTGTKMIVTSPRSHAGSSAASTAAADKLKPKGFTGISRYDPEEYHHHCLPHSAIFFFILNTNFSKLTVNENSICPVHHVCQTIVSGVKKSHISLVIPKKKTHPF